MKLVLLSIVMGYVCCDTVCVDGDCYDPDIDVVERRAQDNPILENQVNSILEEIEDFGINWIWHPTEDFYITDSEITIRQFKHCNDNGFCDDSTFDRSGGRYGCTFGEENDRLPMNCVDFYGAEQMCDYIGGYVCHEHEWNNACEGLNRGQIYPYGNKFKEGKCHLGLYEDRLTPEPTKSRDKCVGGLDGLYDMGGSLSEWLDEGKDNYRKFKPLSFAFNGPVDKPVCQKMCAGNQKEFKSPVIGIRCCSTE